MIKLCTIRTSRVESLIQLLSKKFKALLGSIEVLIFECLYLRPILACSICHRALPALSCKIQGCKEKPVIQPPDASQIKPPHGPWDPSEITEPYIFSSKPVYGRRRPTNLNYRAILQQHSNHLKHLKMLTNCSLDRHDSYTCLSVS